MSKLSVNKGGTALIDALCRGSSAEGVFVRNATEERSIYEQGTGKNL